MFVITDNHTADIWGPFPNWATASAWAIARLGEENQDWHGGEVKEAWWT